MKPSANANILMIGNDNTLAYLINRYAEQSGYHIVVVQMASLAQEARLRKPAALLFLSLEALEAAQALLADLANGDFPVLVCSATADVARARELNADHCLPHPLTYQCFLAALAAIKAPNAAKR